jgi:glycosyltransferase involved in cell wall biosynthesis
MRRKILIIAMMDSIHVGRWLEQFRDQEIDFVIFPSRKFRHIHPRIKHLIDADSQMKVSIYQEKIPHRIYGYVDFFFRVLPSTIFKLNPRLAELKKFIHNHDFEYIHCLEIQGAGYLLFDAITEKSKVNSKIIVTNWGSDVYYFKNFQEHLGRIIGVLALADFYSAECKRDYELAKELGFDGISLPCIPNAGGFNIHRETVSTRASSRKNIVVKTYGGTFGRGDLPIIAVRKILSEFPTFSAFFYSVTEDLLEMVKALVQVFPERVQFSRASAPIPSIELAGIFQISRVYICCSVSDGISTSFLESLVSGAYPIQTDSSCAMEWVATGALASVIPLDLEILSKELRRALSDDELVDRAQRLNRELSIEQLEFEVIKSKALTFYKG